MMRIAGIACKRAKGIRCLIVGCDFYPNGPNFFVAPNCSGKSSLAAAVAPLNSKQLGPTDAERYTGENWGDSSIFVNFKDIRELFRCEGVECR